MFIGVVGSWTATLLYDRHHKKRAQRKWCHLVEHLAQEPIAVNMMPRKITILLDAPPGDGLRVAREHFHEYIKPILVAGALDWEVIEGRREGEVRAGLAEKIRKLRKRNGEQAIAAEDDEEDKGEAVRALRTAMGVQEWEGIQGDLIVGRHTWKEYVRGLHEGWLGPMDPPKSAPAPEVDEPSVEPHLMMTESTKAPDINEESQAPLSTNPTPEKQPEKPPDPPEKPSSKPSPIPPYITPTDYPSTSLAPTIPSELPPSTALTLPHILGFLNTPKRMYRFLHRRHLAEETGASIAALVLAAHYRPFIQSTEFASAIDPDDASPRSIPPEDAVTTAMETWEQDKVLKEAETEWHKSAWKANEEGDTRERVWKEDMVVDPRIGEKMRLFELPEGAAARAEILEEQKRSQQASAWVRMKTWAGYGPREKRGCDMGLEGGEDD